MWHSFGLMFFNRVEAPSLYTSDKLLLILLINTLYSRPSNAERYTKPLKTERKAKDIEPQLNKPLLNYTELSCSPKARNVTRPLSAPSPAAMKALYQSTLAVRRRFSASTETVVGKFSADSVLSTANSRNLETQLYDGDSQLLSDDVYEIRCGNASADSSLASTDDDLLDYRRINVFLQEGSWKHCPSTVHCISISCDITLVVLHEVSTSELPCPSTSVIHWRCKLWNYYNLDIAKRFKIFKCIQQCAFSSCLVFIVLYDIGTYMH